MTPVRAEPKRPRWPCESRTGATVRGLSRAAARTLRRRAIGSVLRSQQPGAMDTSLHERIATAVSLAACAGPDGLVSPSWKTCKRDRKTES